MSCSDEDWADEHEIIWSSGPQTYFPSPFKKCEKLQPRNLMNRQRSIPSKAQYECEHPLWEKRLGFRVAMSRCTATESSFLVNDMQHHISPLVLTHLGYLLKAGHHCWKFCRVCCHLWLLFVFSSHYRKLYVTSIKGKRLWIRESVLVCMGGAKGRKGKGKWYDCIIIIIISKNNF